MEKIGGILVAGGNAKRLYPSTISINKHLLPVYDKPMIYYSLSILLLAGIKDITIICKEKDIEEIKKVIGDEKYLGVDISYSVQNNASGIPDAIEKGFKENEFSENLVVLGDNFIHGSNFFNLLEKNLSQKNTGCQIYTQQLADQINFGVVELNQKKEIIKLIEKPSKNNINYFTIIGLYKFSELYLEAFDYIKVSKRGEYEIIDILKFYNENNLLNVNNIGRGTTWFDMGTYNDLDDCANFVRAIQSRQNKLICSPHEIALNKNLISSEDFSDFIETSIQSDYIKLLRGI